MIEQGTNEWHMQRLGKVTASKIADVMAKTKSGYSASRKNYMSQLVVERMTQTPTDSYTNAAMQWGTDHEPDARAAYEFMTDNAVELSGFVDHPDIEMSGASPDGLVLEEGLIEIKCPNTATHIETLLSRKVDNKYLLQMQWQMECLGRDWCDFVSFDPRMPGDLNLFITRVERDDDLIAEIKAEINKFQAELNSTIEKLTKLKEAA